MSIPKATSENVIELFGVKLRCYALDDGRRIINADDVKALFSVMGEPGKPSTEEEMRKLARFIYGLKKGAGE